MSDCTALFLRVPETQPSCELKPDLHDYKLFRFPDGRIVTLAMTDRYSAGPTSETFFDERWTALPVTEGNHPIRPELKKPATFEQMKLFANRLSEGFPFVRVDFYESSGRLYFGEMTFYPNSGFEHFYPDDWDSKLGNWIDLGLAYDFKR